MLDPDNDPFIVETKPSKPVFWQGPTVNLLEGHVFFMDDMGVPHGSPSWLDGLEWKILCKWMI